VHKTFWPEGCGDYKLGQRARARRELGKENWRQPARVYDSHQNFVVREGKGYKR